MRIPAPTQRRLRMRPLRDGATSIELFFVFALTQVTASVADDLTATGLFRGLLLAGLLWWSWVGYSWLANLVRADEGATKLVLLVSMATMVSMLMITLAIPEAFEDLPGGVHGPTVVAVGYLVFRLLHLALFWLAADGDVALRWQIARFTPSLVVATVLLLVAAQADGVAQISFWVAAPASASPDCLSRYQSWPPRCSGRLSPAHCGGPTSMSRRAPVNGHWQPSMAPRGRSWVSTLTPSDICRWSREWCSWRWA